MTFSRSCEAGGVDWGSGAQQVETQVRRKSINSVIWPQIGSFTDNRRGQRTHWKATERLQKEPRVYPPHLSFSEKLQGVYLFLICISCLSVLSILGKKLILEYWRSSGCALYVNSAFAGNIRSDIYI